MLIDRFKNLPRRALRPIPIFAYQPILRIMADRVAKQHPRLFARLGVHSDKRFLINPTNMPFVLVLHPDMDHPVLKAYRHEGGLTYQASITGSFLNLLRMMDGTLDGDALFFSRKLKVEGDTEAVVCLRNALDDIDGSVAGDVAQLFGRSGQFALNRLRQMET